MPTLYVTEQGARLEKEYRRLLVTKDDQVLLAVPLSHVTHVVLIGRAGMTTPAIHALLDAGVGVSLLSWTGRLRGQLLPGLGGNLSLRHAQYARAQDPAFCLAVGRAIVQGKLRNSRNALRRLLRSRPRLEPGNSLERLRESLTRLPQARDLDELRGLEGMGARAYFSLLRQVVPREWAFPRRSRRPPRDPFNALLSFGYTLLIQNLLAACQVVGLDPFDGFFHGDKYNRPALALDLVEEFRSPVVDSVVLDLVNHGRLRPDDFQLGREGGYYLTARGMRRFLWAYNRRLNTRVYHPRVGRALSYQKIFEVQARLLRKVIEGEEPVYRPFLRR